MATSGKTSKVGTDEQEHLDSSDVLRAMYLELATMLDARIVAVNMFQRSALKQEELESIQSLRDRPLEAAETLLNIVMKQPDAVYRCFLDVLKRTGQHHIYQRLVAGYTGMHSQLYYVLTFNRKH